jgi:hypothetical protein
VGKEQSPSSLAPCPTLWEGKMSDRKVFFVYLFPL